MRPRMLGSCAITTYQERRSPLSLALAVYVRTCEDMRPYPAISAADEVAVAQMLCAVVRRAISQGRMCWLAVSIMHAKGS